MDFSKVCYIADIWGCPSLPKTLARLIVGIYLMIDAMRYKYAKWRTRRLSYAGRLQFIK